MAVGTDSVAGFVAGSHMAVELDCFGGKDLIAVEFGFGNYGRPLVSGTAEVTAAL